MVAVDVWLTNAVAVAVVDVVDANDDNEHVSYVVVVVDYVNYICTNYYSKSNCSMTLISLPSR